jgi:hypothetical protein
VFGTHSEVLDVTELSFEELSVSSRDDVDDVPRVGAECLKTLDESWRGESCRGVLDDRSEGTVVVEEEETLRGRLVLLDNGVTVERRSVLGSLFALKGFE